MKDQNNFREKNWVPTPIEQPRYAISCQESRIENNRSFYGSFFLGPFLPGQSLTIANAIRRTLLSDLKGIAIVSVQIQGVLHEYSSMPGVRDSVLDVLLNMKEIVLKNKYSNASCCSVFPQIGYLHVQGPGIVRAADFKLPPFIQVVDPNQYIATLAHDGAINMKFLISEGKSLIANPACSSQIGFANTSVLTGQGASASLYSKQGDKNQNLITAPQITNHLNHLKKRNLLLKKIKKTIKLDSQKQLTNFSDSLRVSGAGAPDTVAIQKGLPLDIKKPLVRVERAQKKQIDSLSKPLHIDAVFSPITKVNYVIEYSEHKTIDSSFSKSQQIKDFLNLVKPFKQLANVASTSPSTYQEKQTNPLSKKKGAIGLGPSVPKPIKRKKNKGNPYAGQQSNSSNNTYSIDEMINLIADTGMKSSAHQKSFHNIVLEIWTNGSLHPKEALSQALKELNQVVSEIAGLQQLWGATQNFNLQQFKYERNYQKLDLLLNTYTSYNFMPLNNSFYSSNYSVLNKYNQKIAKKSKIAQLSPVLNNQNWGDAPVSFPPLRPQTTQKEGLTFAPAPLRAPEGEVRAKKFRERNFIEKSVGEAKNRMTLNFWGTTTSASALGATLHGGLTFAPVEVREKSQIRPEKNLSSLEISNLNLSLAIYTKLKRSNINTIGDLLSKSKKDLLISTKLSLKSIGEIEKSFFNFGLSFS